MRFKKGERVQVFALLNSGEEIDEACTFVESLTIMARPVMKVIRDGKGALYIHPEGVTRAKSPELGSCKPV
jgi:hypothetical protein